MLSKVDPVRVTDIKLIETPGKRWAELLDFWDDRLKRDRDEVLGTDASIDVLFPFAYVTEWCTLAATTLWTTFKVRQYFE